MKIMNKNKSDMYTLMHNFETLKTHLKIHCARFLGNILEQWHHDIENIKKSETFGLLNEHCQEEIVKRNSFVLSIPVLCEVLIQGNMCTGHKNIHETHENFQLRITEMQPFYDDIISLNRIWKTHIVDNHHETMTSDVMKQLCEKFWEIGVRMAERFPQIGQTYLDSIQPLRPDETPNEILTAQIGNRNTMSIKFGKQMDAPFFIEQIGNKNKMIIQLDDRRQSEQLELQSTGEVSLRMVLRSNDTPEWKKITENAMKTNLANLNSNPVLKENDIVVDSFEKGCLVVSFNKAYGYPMKDCLKILFNELFQVLDVEATLQNYSISLIQVRGYIYYPENFSYGKTCQDMFIIRHISWKNASTLCDIDIYVNNLMKHLIQNKCSTDVNEQINLQVKWDEDLSMAASPIPFSSSANRLLSEEMKTAQLELQNWTEYDNAIYFIFKCTGKFSYLSYVEEGGAIYNTTKLLFSSVSTSLLRLSVFLDTTFVNDSGFGQGLVFHINPSSKVSEALASGTFSKVVTAMIGGKDTSVFRNVEDLKIKAILEYRDGMLFKLTPKEDILSSEQQENVVKTSKDRVLSVDAMEEESIIDPFFRAWEIGNPKIVLRLLEEGRNPNLRNKKLQSPLHIASEGNFLRITEKLLLCGAEIDAIDKNLDTPLILAVRNGHWKIVSTLLNKGSNVELGDKNNHSPLYVAAKYGHRYALTTLLKFGALVNSTGDNKETPLHVACRKGYDEIVHDLLMYGADVHSVDKRGNTPLHTALLGMANEYHNSEIVENLLSRGALVNKKNNTAKTPLCIASENGLKNVTQILVKAFADTNLQDSENDLPLHLAIRNGHTDIVEIFWKTSNNIDRCNAKGITPRMLAKNHEDILKIVDAFERTEDISCTPAMNFARRGLVGELLPYIQQNEQLDSKDNKGISLLYAASCNGHTEIVRLLIKAKVNVNACDFMNKSPLSIAAENKYYSVVECLLDAGADVNIVDSFGRTVLHYAVKSDSNEIVNIILQQSHYTYKADVDGKTPLHFCGIYGNASIANDLLTAMVSIDVNQCDLQKSSPLHETIKSQQLDVADFLLSHGANANFPDSSGRTPLHLAAEIGSLAATNMLLKSGGNVNERNSLLHTPAFLAASFGRSVLLTLIKNGSDINVPDEKGRTPLHVSLENGHIFVIKILIEHNATVNSKDKEGKTPLHLASKLGNLNAASILLKANAIVNAADSNRCTPLHYCTSNVLLKLLIKNGAFVNSKDAYGKTPLHKAVEFLCRSDLTSNATSEYLTIVNELLSNDANIVLRDNNNETVIHKLVHASNYHLLIEVLGFDFDPDEKDSLVIIVGDCLKQSDSSVITDILKRWVCIQQTREENEQIGSIYTQEEELCPSYLWHQHEEWLRKHKNVRRANVLQRIMSIEKDLSGMEGRKRKDSIKESALVEPLEKIVKVEGELKAL